MLLGIDAARPGAYRRRERRQNHHAAVGSGPVDPAERGLSDAVQADQPPGGPRHPLRRVGVCRRRGQGLPALLDDAEPAAGGGRPADGGERLAAGGYLLQVPAAVARLPRHHKPQGGAGERAAQLRLSHHRGRDRHTVQRQGVRVLCTGDQAGTSCQYYRVRHERGVCCTGRLPGAGAAAGRRAAAAPGGAPDARAHRLRAVPGVGTETGRQAEEPGRAQGQHVKRAARPGHSRLRLPDRIPALPQERRAQAERGGDRGVGFQRVLRRGPETAPAQTPPSVRDLCQCWPPAPAPLPWCIIDCAARRAAPCLCTETFSSLYIYSATRRKHPE